MPPSADAVDAGRTGSPRGVTEVIAVRAAPLLRSKDYQAAHRQPAPSTKPVLGQRSPWERPREGFTDAMNARASQASQTREGRSVKGITIATEKF